MSKKATEFQKRAMSKVYRGREIFKPLHTETDFARRLRKSLMIHLPHMTLMMNLTIPRKTQKADI